MERERKGGGQSALPVPGGELPEKQRGRGWKAVSHDLQAGRRGPSPTTWRGMMGWVGGHSPTQAPVPVWENNENISLFSSTATPPLLSPPPNPFNTPLPGTPGKMHRNKEGGGGQESHQSGCISPAWAWAPGSPGPRSLSTRGEGASLGSPPSCSGSSNQAQPPPSPPAPLGRGTRTTCLQPAPAPSSRRPGLARPGRHKRTVTASGGGGALSTPIPPPALLQRAPGAKRRARAGPVSGSRL